MSNTHRTAPERGELITTGKAKSLYATDHPDQLIMEFRDDTSAFDGKKTAQLANKGEVNNRINEIVMRSLEQSGIPTHLIERTTATESLVRNLKMLPLEAVVRNIATGSLCRRLGVEDRL
ncbi:MAG: phosphoribosylaminoimidazolesuccinocarboxamide synthase, partial [Gammaproteobacteria bacterium AqS3]|nr:phosphoribosylaminoimidazolesuccinocarboxamide synthase [Gammaproteobacteria bacterium AqS3]